LPRRRRQLSPPPSIYAVISPSAPPPLPPIRFCRRRFHFAISILRRHGFAKAAVFH